MIELLVSNLQRKMRKRTVEEYSRGLALSLDDFTRLEMTVHTMLTLARLEQPPEPHQARSSRNAISRSCDGSFPDCIFPEIGGE
jgi:hypothetical protein